MKKFILSSLLLLCCYAQAASTTNTYYIPLVVPTPTSDTNANFAGVVSGYSGSFSNGIISQGLLTTKWTSVTPDDTNSVVDLLSGNNFYYTLSTSNYLIFSNITSGASGYIKVFSDGVGQEFNFSASYDNWTSNTYAPVFVITNRAIIEYFTDFGSDATNVNLKVLELK